ncbi:cubilin-like [Anneissia japonica]|uniref:cubilin-like n=1 Tax=Anneissia japonica TaxID=1529436 RepID=UPI0014259AAE|nr:cubilin-like [Anneissia japonica]
MYSKPTWHDRRGYPPAPFPYRDTPRPLPSSTLSSNTPQYQQPQYPTLQQIHNNRKVRHNKRSRSKRRQQKKRKGCMQRRHIAIDMPIFNRRKAILITNSLLLTLFWITLASLITFGIFMCLYVFNFDDVTPTEEPAENLLVPLVARTFDGSFALLTINGSTANFQPAFNDPSSEEYVELADAIEVSLDDIYMPIDNATYVGSTVTGFQEGSIITNFKVMFEVRENSSLDLETELKLTLIDAIEGGRPTGSNLLLGADRDTVVIMPGEAGPVTSTPSTNPATPTREEVIIDPTCGNENIELDQTYMKQRLRSYGYPDLHANISCTWLITSPQYTTIHVEFTDFGTMTESEYIRIGNGLNSTDMESVLFEYSGNQIPSGIFKSTENTLWIQFVGSIGSRGFSLYIEYHIDCGGDVVLSAIHEPEVITSLGYPHGLNVPFHCLWLVVSPSETKMVVTIHDFDIIFPTDWVRIGKGLNESYSNSIIFEHSGQGVETTKFISSSNELWISYNSRDGTTQRGFNVTISYGPLYECGTTSHVSLSGAEYSNTRWPWLVSLVADEDVIHNFSCNAIIVGKRWLLTTAKCLINFSSEKFLMARVNGSTNSILLEVDDFLIHPGFNSTYNTDLAVVRLSTNISFSEHVRHICFPMTHTPYERCFIIGLEMTNPIEIDQEMLENVENCMGVDPNEFCVALPDDVESNVQEAQQTQLICTNSDGYWDSVGIAGNVSLSSLMNEHILTYTNISTFVGWIQDAIANWDQYDTIKVTCGRKEYQLNITESQILSSPNYPSNYPLYITCDWTIVAPENYRVLLHILDFSTQFCCDLVTLSDVNSSLVLSGDIESEYLISTGNQVDVIFHTDKFTTERGFMISIEAILENDEAAYREL